MIRRAVLVAAAAAALIFAPTAAMAAYDAPDFSASVSDSTPAVGQSVTLTVMGGMANANQPMRLVLTSGSTSPRTLNATANASGVATFTFTLGSAGTFTARVFNAAGALVSDQTLTVTAASAASGGAAGAADAVSGANLAKTGSDSMGLALGGGVLVLAGSGAVLVARRRRASQVPA
jgi:LPXTG-motif cell wall-anchored protein